jgi:uncharacterized membrane protein
MVSMGSCYALSVEFCVILGAIVGESLCLIYGIYAVIPAGPFEQQNLALGVPLIVLGSIGIGALAGAIAGCITGGIVCSPLLCRNCCNDQV